MIIALWLAFAVLLWIVGFFRAGFAKANRLALDRAFVRPPVVIYTLCGRPRIQGVPKGVVSLSALLAQLQAIYLAACAIAFYAIRIVSATLQTFIVFLGTIVVCSMGFWLHSRYPYKPE